MGKFLFTILILIVVSFGSLSFFGVITKEDVSEWIVGMKHRIQMQLSNKDVQRHRSPAQAGTSREQSGRIYSYRDGEIQLDEIFSIRLSNVKTVRSRPGWKRVSMSCIVYNHSDDGENFDFWSDLVLYDNAGEDYRATWTKSAGARGIGEQGGWTYIESKIGRPGAKQGKLEYEVRSDVEEFFLLYTGGDEGSTVRIIFKNI